MAYQPYARLTFAKKMASEIQRPGAPLQISSETVMDSYFRSLHIQVMIDARVKDTDRDAVITAAKNDVIGLLSGQGIKKIVDRAINVTCQPRKLEKGVAPTIFIPHHEGIQVEEKRIERVALKPSISEDVVRRQMRLMLNAINHGRRVSQNSLDNLLKVLKPDLEDSIAVTNTVPAKNKEFDAMLVLMLHVVEIEKNPIGYSKIRLSQWSKKTPELLEAIKNVDLKDPIVRIQLGIIAMSSPFKRVRNAAERALKGQR